MTCFLDLERRRTALDKFAYLSHDVGTQYSILNAYCHEVGAVPLIAPPAQYLKQLRLSTARNLLIFKGEPAYLTAHHVGYESANQFSREFKRYFGLPPSRIAELPYSALGGVV